MTTINERIAYIVEQSGLSKTAFAESLKVSQQYISKLVKTGMPSDLLIDDLCQKYNVREEWLRDGILPIYYSLTENQQIQEYANRVMEDVPGSIRRRITIALSKFNDDDWEDLDRLLDLFAKKDQG